MTAPARGESHNWAGILLSATFVAGVFFGAVYLGLVSPP